MDAVDLATVVTKLGTGKFLGNLPRHALSNLWHDRAQSLLSLHHTGFQKKFN